ncbi:MAG: SBBP repeat-containing protein [candidate division WOR-3 bacterium]|nr:SBBP repeat-containing protein [candidate division WOR-3 bacterium]
MGLPVNLFATQIKAVQENPILDQVPPWLPVAVLRYNHPCQGHQPDDYPVDIEVDNNGNIYVTGSTMEDWRQITTLFYEKDEQINVWTLKEVKHHPSTSGEAKAAALALYDGYCYVTGHRRNGELCYDWVTIKYPPNLNGEPEWEKYVNGPGSGYDYAKAITIDNDGYIYVTGYVDNGGDNHDWYTIKYSPNGIEQWFKQENLPYDDEPAAIAMDNLGNVVVTGYRESDVGGGLRHKDYMTIWYDSDDGTKVGERFYDTRDHFDDEAVGLAVDNSGFVYVTGYSNLDHDGGRDDDYLTIRYTPQGQGVHWVMRKNGGGHDRPHAIAIDNNPQGSYVYVTGESFQSENGFDYLTVIYTNNGAEWRVKYDDYENDDDIANAITVGNNRDFIYVTGKSHCDETHHDYWSIMYDSNLNPIRENRYFGINAHETDEAVAMTIDESFVYVTGYSWGGDAWTINYDYATTILPVGKHDVGCTAIEVPTGTVDYLTMVTPKCRVYNYGDVPETYEVRMKIGYNYNHTFLVQNHQPGVELQITFDDDWLAGPPGIQTVECETELVNDMEPANDKQIGAVFVRFLDIGCIKINVPVGQIRVGEPITPSCNVHNFGNSLSNSFIVHMEFDDPDHYTEEIKAVEPLHLDETRIITFSEWIPNYPGNYTATFYTIMDGDMERSNDLIEGPFEVIGERDFANIDKNENTIEPVFPEYQSKNEGVMESYVVQIKNKKFEGLANLKIYDVLGHLLRSEKVDKPVFTVNGLPSGVYIVRLEAKGFNEVRKLLIVK